MAFLHELLAVNSNAMGQAQKARTDLEATMEKKPHLFQSRIVTYSPSAEGGKEETREQSSIQTTVAKEVVWLNGIVAKAIDVGYQIDLANREAKADVILEGHATPLLVGVPATALLQLEKRLKEVQGFIHTIKTLDPARGFTVDTTREKGTYVAREVEKASTKKEPRVIVQYPATKEHPAQTALIQEDVRVGTIREQEWSSLITPAMKAEILDNCDQLLRAVAAARSRANRQEIEADSHKIGKKLLDFIFKPLLT